MKSFAGIGSRETPIEVLKEMTRIGKILSDRGYILRSGGADGADSAFEEEYDPNKKEIYLPWPGFNNKTGILSFNLPKWKEAETIMERIHPAPYKLTFGAKKLQTRNIFQILGKDLIDPVEFVICWTREGKDVGGTRTAIVLAREFNIPIHNMGNKDYINLW